MTPKEKAQQLHDDIYKVITNGKYHRNKHLGVEYTPDKWKEAKECALLSVYEIIKTLPQSEYLEDRLEMVENRELIYWKQVKQEIEKL